MGNINSSHLFGLDEMIIFAFYVRNKNRYRRAADIGANIGLHSIVMAKLGLEVDAYEPDPVTYSQLVKNLLLNSVSEKVLTTQKAVSISRGKVNFTRAIGNTTGSHISGAKDDP